MMGRVVQQDQRILAAVEIGDLRHRVARRDILQNKAIRPCAATGIVAGPGMKLVIAAATVQEIDRIIVLPGAVPPQQVIAIIAVDVVRPVAAHHPIIVQAALQRVVTGPAAQDIRAIAADQAIIALACRKTVAPAVAADLIGAFTTVQPVVTRLALQIVGAVGPGHGIGTLATAQPVDTRAAVHHVSARTPAQKVISRVSADQVVAAVAGQNVVGRPARQRHVVLPGHRTVMRQRHPGFRIIRIVQQRSATAHPAGRPAVAVRRARHGVLPRSVSVIARHQGIHQEAGKGRAQQSQQSQHVAHPHGSQAEALTIVNATHWQKTLLSPELCRKSGPKTSRIAAPNPAILDHG